MKTAKIINVRIERTEQGLFRATSADLVGLHVVADNEELLKERAKAMLADLFSGLGQDVRVFEADVTDAGSRPPWVVVPNSSDSLAH